MAFLIPYNARNPETAPALARILPLWERLAFGADLADPFCSGPQWQLSCQETFEPWRRIYLKSADNSLLVLSEMRDDQGNGILMPLDSDWLFGTTLLGPESPDLLEEALAELRQLYNPCLLVVYLSGIEENADFAAFARRFRKNCLFHLHNESVQCMASLAGGLDGFLSRRSAHHRAKIRRAWRRARSEGIVFERFNPENPALALQLYQRMLAVEERSWKGLGHCGMTEPAPRQFYANLLRRTSQTGMARIIIASRDGRDIGFIFGSIGGATYRGQQFSHDLDFARYSPGHVLQLEMIDWLCEEGLERYDLGPCSGPGMQYKCHWIDHVRPIRTWALVCKA